MKNVKFLRTLSCEIQNVSWGKIRGRVLALIIMTLCLKRWPERAWRNTGKTLEVISVFIFSYLFP